MVMQSNPFAMSSNTFNLDTANKTYVIHVDDRMLDAAFLTSVPVVVRSSQ